MYICMCVYVCYVVYLVFIFFFKQKTAYEMRISDWSSDVCSSDLLRVRFACKFRGNQIPIFSDQLGKAGKALLGEQVIIGIDLFEVVHPTHYPASAAVRIDVGAPIYGRRRLMQRRKFRLEKILIQCRPCGDRSEERRVWQESVS